MLKCPYCGSTDVTKAGYPHPPYILYCKKCGAVFDRDTVRITT